jgi:hypothetical protein
MTTGIRVEIKIEALRSREIPKFDSRQDSDRHSLSISPAVGRGFAAGLAAPGRVLGLSLYFPAERRDTRFKFPPNAMIDSMA